MLDDVGMDALRFYNPLVATASTPKLAQLAAGGVRFTKTYSNPLCSPTRATILTGRHAFRTGMGNLSTSLDSGGAEYSLPLIEQTIPEVLKSGVPSQDPQYTCGAFGKWHLTTSVYKEHPIDQGFDKFVGTVENTGGHYNWDLVRASAQPPATTTHIGQPWPDTNGAWNESTFSASVIRQEAAAWIASVPQPFFAYVCFNPPHVPCEVPPYSLLSQSTLDAMDQSQYPAGEPQSPGADSRLAYDWMLEAVDTEIGRLVDGMSAVRRANTTVLIVGDNGTPTAVIYAPPYAKLHAKGSVYEQGTLVPLIANGRDVDCHGEACNALVNTVDVYRTILALAGVAPPSNVDIDGISFKHLLANPAGVGGRANALVEYFMPHGSYIPADYDDHCTDFVPKTSFKRAMTDGRYKYVRSYSAPFQQAFDLLSDPLETINIWPWAQDACTATPCGAEQVAIWALRNAMVDLSGM